ncbi:hypothetical protein BEWA_009190 [Theileria equi strain WA]|uniref:Topoisomerase 6 subunit A/Spo11 TOPRIM domain-containing protein n=1 Tax=Theileria equi strain WA TaxID=1537102 RepID=L0B0X2_THEEQ|nr:hypothetical protein BEWA_009190 [Theileria equi strain WA]AFZ81507.1 hypothetical protein BEWA_009190 [Theileria equi strain WA]|eukprot:XP_004831173.1 hypothetical protein BEWA_009190 [Theileria equi strain WA]
MTALQPSGCSITSFGTIEVKLWPRGLRYVLIVEKETIYYRLLQCAILKRHNPCVMILSRGFPDIATRELLYEIRNHSKKLNVPILCLTDFNRAGLNIALTFYRGPIKTNYYTNECSIPELKWLYLGKRDSWDPKIQSVYEMNDWREILQLMASCTYNLDEITDLEDRLIKILEKP